jgi:hypothetical protein
MGYMRHHAIVVTGYDDRVTEAHRRAADVFLPGQVTEVVVSPVNDYRSFMVATDGSKEGWSESDDGDDRRAAFVGWLNDQRYGDGSSPFDWVVVQYGDDDLETAVVDDVDAARRAEVVTVKTGGTPG